MIFQLDNQLEIIFKCTKYCLLALPRLFLPKTTVQTKNKHKLQTSVEFVIGLVPLPQRNLQIECYQTQQAVNALKASPVSKTNHLIISPGFNGSTRREWKPLVLSASKNHNF